MKNIHVRNNQLIFYGNPAGYIKENRAIVDRIFQSKELEEWLSKKYILVEWKEGVFERLAKGEQLNGASQETALLKKVRIWQLKPDSEFELRFRSYEETQKFHGEPSSNNYQVVYDGELDTNDLEEIYSKFNFEQPNEFVGHSLSISDVVELYDEGGGSFYFVDRIGYKEICFTKHEPDQDITMKL